MEPCPEDGEVRVERIALFESKSPWHFTGIRFNYFMGLLSLIGIPAIHSFIDLENPPWWVGIIGLLFYGGEAWAVIHRLNLSRARIIYERSKGDLMNTHIRPREPSPLLWYGFLMRFCLRIGLFVFCFFALGVTFDEDPAVWMIILMCLAVLGELFLMLYSMYDTGVFRLYSEPDEKEKDEAVELAWRKKMDRKVRHPGIYTKQLLADGILAGVVLVFNNALWNPVNESFYGFIAEAESFPAIIFSLLFSLFSALVIYYLLMLPLRLPFWVEEAMEVKDARSAWNYRFSMLFAGFSLIVPSVWKVLGG